MQCAHSVNIILINLVIKFNFIITIDIVYEKNLKHFNKIVNKPIFYIQIEGHICHRCQQHSEHHVWRKSAPFRHVWYTCPKNWRLIVLLWPFSLSESLDRQRVENYPQKCANWRWITERGWGVSAVSGSNPTSPRFNPMRAVRAPGILWHTDYNLKKVKQSKVLKNILDFLNFWTETPYCTVYSMYSILYLDIYSVSGGKVGAHFLGCRQCMLAFNCCVKLVDRQFWLWPIGSSPYWVK